MYLEYRLVAHYITISLQSARMLYRKPRDQLKQSKFEISAAKWHSGDKRASRTRTIAKKELFLDGALDN